MSNTQLHRTIVSASLLFLLAANSHEQLGIHQTLSRSFRHRKSKDLTQR
jgi:hypothetical protein